MLGFDISLTLKYRHFQQNYIDLGRIGSGGFARVHKVLSKLDNNNYAIKIIEIKPNQCKTDLIDTIHKFLDQVKILSYLNHKNIIQYHGCWIQTQQLQSKSSHSHNQTQLNQNHHYDSNNNQNNSHFQSSTHEQQADEQIVMVMEEQFSSNGIQFDYEQNSNGIGFHNSEQQNNNFFNNSDNNKQKNNKNKNNKVEQNKKNNLNIPVDHSAASVNIRNNYKLIKIFILSQLCQGNVQSYLYLRNLNKKNIQPFKHSPNSKLTNKIDKKQTNNNKPSFCSPIPTKILFNHQPISNKQSIPKQQNIQKQLKTTQNKIQKDELIQSYKMIIQIIEGLQYLHSKKIIHRDIKLHNIVIDKNKKCKIIDYGLAKKARMLQSISQYPKDLKDIGTHIGSSSVNNLNKNGQEQVDEIFSSSVGTRIYSSPQQISSQKYDHRTDIYSLAIVILMFFCDFTTNHEQLQIIQRIRKNQLQFIECDSRLKEILSRCLSQQKKRPRLSEVKNVVKILLRQRYQIQSNRLQQNKYKNIDNIEQINNKNNRLEKQQSVYIIENSKLKKKLSKQDYYKLNCNHSMESGNQIIKDQNALQNKQQSGFINHQSLNDQIGFRSHQAQETCVEINDNHIE